MTAKEAFLGVVDDVVASCLIPVPSSPLMALGEAVSAGTEAIESGDETMAELELLWDVWDAAEGLDWSFYPENDYDSRKALISIHSVHSLADALHAYREHINRAR